jgi:hypothetical protein
LGCGRVRRHFARRCSVSTGQAAGAAFQALGIGGNLLRRMRISAMTLSRLLGAFVAYLHEILSIRAARL